MEKKKLRAKRGCQVILRRPSTVRSVVSSIHHKQVITQVAQQQSIDIYFPSLRAAPISSYFSATTTQLDQSLC